MADRMRTIRFGMALMLTALAGSVSAQAVMADPTRPAAGVAGNVLSPETSGPVLQSVIIPKKGKPIAVIGGQQVVLGGMYGESRLIKLSDREAVLEGSGGIERLPLTPGIEKTNIVIKNPTAKEMKNRGKP